MTAGPNPLFGGLKSTVSVFGRTSHIWIEGEGMLHALYFMKNAHGDWSISYKNRYVESETFKIEKQGNKPAFVPTIEGDSPAILAAALLNMVKWCFPFRFHLLKNKLAFHKSNIKNIGIVVCWMNSKHVVSQFSVLSHIFQLRFGMVSKQISNTSIFEHSGEVLC